MRVQPGKKNQFDFQAEALSRNPGGQCGKCGWNGVAVNRSKFSGQKDRGRTFDRIAASEWSAVEIDRSLRVENILCLHQVD